MNESFDGLGDFWSLLKTLWGFKVSAPNRDFRERFLFRNKLEILFKNQITPSKAFNLKNQDNPSPTKQCPTN
jgi:hypothetical protein